MSTSTSMNVLWFRHGLRLHDNPTLHEAVQLLKQSSENGEEMQEKPPQKRVLLPIFIFDGESAGTKLCGYNRFKFLIECLQDLDEQFKSFGSRLFVARGKPIDVFRSLNSFGGGIANLCFEQDCEPVWKTRDEGVKAWCKDNDIHWVERIGHTLWNPHEVINVNGGTPPLTFSMFNHVAGSLGQPERPLADIDLSKIPFAKLSADVAEEIGLFETVPQPEDFGVKPECEVGKVYHGGERVALKQLEVRLQREAVAFAKGSFLPNQQNPDILCPPKSLSPDLRFGSLSVRKFYWGILDAFKDSQKGSKKPFNPQIVSQLVWREFFYTMSVNNQYYDEMERNEICINIPWYPHENNEKWQAFVEARTGFPFIDAGMRQLYKEGWIHHVVRNAISCFLTRGDLWISWEAGLQVFLKNLLDADWSVCAGNWMWISSSAFEQVLNCSNCIDPGTYGRRTDPWGEYVKRFVPELSKLPVEYLYEPWRAPADVQAKAGCIIGKDYPERIVRHEEACKDNMAKMHELKEGLVRQMCQVPVHCAPSDEKETREFMAFPDSCCHNSSGGGALERNNRNDAGGVKAVED